MKSVSSKLFLSLAILSLAANLWLIAQLSETHIRPRKAKDCSVEMLNMAGGWEEIILGHGYTDNYSVAKYVVDLAEKDESAKTEGLRRRFRVKVH